MIVLNICLDGIYCFDAFQLNLSYPKKVVNSLIEEEHLKGRNRFRYCKAVILTGSNATGKTCLGRALHRIFKFLSSGNPAVLNEMITDRNASFSIDFVNEGYVLHRVAASFSETGCEPEIHYFRSEIGVNDSYEMCIRKLEDHTDELISSLSVLKKRIGPLNCRFSYPDIEPVLRIEDLDQKELLRTLRAVIGTLDPTLQNIEKSDDLKNSFIIRRKEKEIIIQEGKLLNREYLSSGTAEGIDVAIFLASMRNQKSCFYYCDEHFSFIQSDIEKRIFGIMLENLSDNSQMIFTTHNVDMLDLNLPKHAYCFLRKTASGEDYRITAVSASVLLKRNTDSVRSAAENDLFSSLPDESLLDGLEEEYES